MVRALSYNEHVFKLITLWRVLGKYKARHPQEIIHPDKAMLTQEFKVLIAITVLPLTGILLCVLTEKVFSSLPRETNNISISILYWISIGTAKREHKFLLCHTWISSFKKTQLFSVPNPLACVFCKYHLPPLKKTQHYCLLTFFQGKVC